MNILGQVGTKLFTAKTLTEVGFIRPMRPDKLLRTGLNFVRWGPTPAAGYATGSLLYPNELAGRGIEEGDNVAILCRNHRGFIDITVALSKLGANALYLNTGFAGPQIAEVSEREHAKAIVYDEEFAELVAEGAKDRLRFVAW